MESSRHTGSTKRRRGSRGRARSADGEQPARYLWHNATGQYRAERDPLMESSRHENPDCPAVRDAFGRARSADGEQPALLVLEPAGGPEQAERDPLMESSRHVSASLGRGPSVYKRELPAILAVLEQLPAAPELVIVDAYVDLGPGRPGLGRRLFDAIGIPVIGVAKTRFAEADAIEVLRGSSARPLFVTAAGVDAMKAAAWIREMHGASRLPTLLKLVDRLARSRQ